MDIVMESGDGEGLDFFGGFLGASRQSPIQSSVMALGLLLRALVSVPANQLIVSY